MKTESTIPIIHHKLFLLPIKNREAGEGPVDQEIRQLGNGRLISSDKKLGSQRDQNTIVYDRGKGRVETEYATTVGVNEVRKMLLSNEHAFRQYTNY